MQVREKTHHIDATLNGAGTEHIIAAIRERFPNAEIIADTETERWDNTELAADIRLRKTPGKLLRAYRERAGMTITSLAHAVGTKYPNISAMENDRRVIGLQMARKLGSVLGVDYHKFLNA
jgi:DNA-binding XRE family transcriptional regulator